MITSYTSQQPIDDFGLRFADIKESATLAATTDTSFTIPGVAPNYKAVIKVSVGSSVWVAINAVAAVPAGAAFAATTSELVNDAFPLCRQVKGGDVLHFFAPAANASVSIVLYALDYNS